MDDKNEHKEFNNLGIKEELLKGVFVYGFKNHHPFKLS